MMKRIQLMMNKKNEINDSFKSKKKKYIKNNNDEKNQIKIFLKKKELFHTYIW